MTDKTRAAAAPQKTGGRRRFLKAATATAATAGTLGFPMIAKGQRRTSSTSTRRTTRRRSTT
jgi:hypothetical protein